MKKKVLILVRRLDKGGAEMLECRLAAQLVQLGYEIYLGAQYSSNYFLGREKAAYWKGRGVHDVLFLKSEGLFGSVMALFRLIKFQKQYNFDNIISSNTGLQTLTGLASFFIRTRQIAAFHDYSTPSRNKSLRIWLWKILISRVDAGYAISDYVRCDITVKIRALHGKVVVVYNSIDESKLIPDKQTVNIRSELNLPESAKLILYVGRLNYRKGLDLVLDYLGDSLVKWNAYILVLGEKIDVRNLDYGKLDFQALLSEKIEKIQIRDRVHFLGFRTDAYNIMSQSNLLAHLARHEGFGLIFIEAFAAGLPILASNVGGIPEVLAGTAYHPFDIMHKTEIIQEADRILNLTDDERHKLLLQARSRVPFFNDQRRALDISNILKGLMQ